MSKTELNTLFIQAPGPGCSIPGPCSLNPERLIKILMDLDQSNAPRALAWSGSIRSVGLGCEALGLELSCVFWVFIDNCTSCLLIEPPMHAKFLAKKIPKNCHEFLDTFLTFWCWFHMLKLMKNMRAYFFFLNVYVVVFVKFSCIILVLIQYHGILMLVIWFCDTFAVSL